MPISRRSSLTSTPGAKMSLPSYSTFPVIFTSGTRSFMRFKVFKKVDLPQPEGPIKAVMAFSLMPISMFFSAWVFPYQRQRSLTVIMSFIGNLLLYREISRFLFENQFLAPENQPAFFFLKYLPAKSASRLIISVIIIRMAAMAKAVSKSPCSLAYT